MERRKRNDDRLPRAIRYTFSGGEWSPRVLGRSDLEKYYSALQTEENFISTPHGPAESRPGTRFVAEVKTSSKKVRLIPFQFSSSQAYILEFGDLYMRVYKNGGQVAGPYEIVTPYTESELPDIQYVQSADTMYLVHPTYEPRKLVRTADNAWTLSIIGFNPPPTKELGLTPSVSVDPAATSGDGVNFTTGAAFWQTGVSSGDIGQEITFGTARATIVSITSTTVAVADITSVFPNTNVIPAGSWKLESGTPTVILASVGSTKLTVGTLKTLRLQQPAGTNVNGWHDGTDTPVGRFVYFNGGILKVTQRVNAIDIKGRLIKAITTDADAPAGAWTLEDLAWTTALGYPRSVSLFESRAFYGGTSTFPNSFWGSLTGDFEAFGKGATDDDSLSATLASPLVDVIQWIAPLRRLFLGTFGAEYVINNGLNDPLTPTNITVRDETALGSPHIQPIRTDDALVFVDISATGLQELAFSLERDSFIANNLLLLAEHITGETSGTITRVAFQRNPIRILWAVRSDGTLVGITILREQNVTAVHRQIIGGAFSGGNAVVEDIAVIPHWTKPVSTAFVLVKRTINGATKRYIEYFDTTLETDSALTRTPNGTPVASVSGLGHLEGQTVWVKGDGIAQAQRVVSGSAVAVSPSADAVEVGLAYTSTLTVPPLQGKGENSITGLVRRVIKTYVDFETAVEVTIRGIATTLSIAPAVFADVIEVETLGYDKKGLITIIRNKPYKTIIKDIVAEVAVNEDRR